MHLMYYLDAKGGRIYTLKVRKNAKPNADRFSNYGRCTCSHPAHPGLFGTLRSLLSAPSLPLLHGKISQKETPEGKPTESAHPARFSPDDKFSKHRLICKRRFGLLPTQNPQTPL